jgi:hypothetical protein
MSNGELIVSNPERPKPLIGLIPGFNLYFLNAAWEAIKPGIEELCAASNGEYEPHKLYMGIHNAALHLYMGYIDKTGKVKQEDFQVVFPEKLRTPKEDYAGFLIVQFREDAAHIYAGYVVPEYRNTNLMELGLKFIEDQIRKVPFPYMTMATHPSLAKLLQGLGYNEMTMNFRKKL